MQVVPWVDEGSCFAARASVTVAIKLPLEEVAADAERLSRFEREARVLAALDHPHVATLHGFERDGDTHFLVMELVEGETLADRIARGPIPLAANEPDLRRYQGDDIIYA